MWGNLLPQIHLYSVEHENEDERVLGYRVGEEPIYDDLPIHRYIINILWITLPVNILHARSKGKFPAVKGNKNVKRDDPAIPNPNTHYCYLDYNNVIQQRILESEYMNIGLIRI